MRWAVLALTVCLLCLSLVNSPYPNEQWLQHVPTIGMLGGLALCIRKRWLSTTSFFCAFGFVWLHIIGARWIYSFVPYDDWSEALCGTKLSVYFDWQRNHYDRLVHLASGVLGVPVAVDFLELAFSRAVRATDMSQPDGAPTECDVQAAWKPGSIPIPIWLTSLLAVAIILAVGALYEILEWQIAVFFSPTQAEAYNGQQGDIWDAQKDLALAGIGGVLAAGWHCAQWKRPAT